MTLIVQFFLALVPPAMERGYDWVMEKFDDEPEEEKKKAITPPLNDKQKAAICALYTEWQESSWVVDAYCTTQGAAVKEIIHVLKLNKSTATVLRIAKGK